MAADADAVRGIAAMFAAQQQAVSEVHDSLPKQGLQKEKVKDLAAELAAQNDDPKDGRFSGCVYHDFADGYTDFLNEVMGLFQWTNPLHGNNFAGVRMMEAGLISMVVKMFNGGAESKFNWAKRACGAMTSGGTESIMLAMLAYRKFARRARGITEPELVVPVTAHAAFDKAAYYFGLTIRKVPLDKDCRVDVEKMEALITPNTICLVGSAPNFPHGIIDPIPEIAELGRRYRIPVHVDACLGGFLVAFMKKAGYELPHPVDFSLRGVTSISCDTHKYGFACKGSSVIMYREPKRLRDQMHATPNWPGGIYATPTFAGSRPGNIVAGTWAALMHHGEDGYVSATRKVISTARWIAEECAKVPGLKVIGKPLVSVIALRSDEFDIYVLMTLLASKGWALNALQFPPSIHFCVTLMHAKETQGHTPAERFIEDCLWAAKKCPSQKATGMAAMYGSSQLLKNRKKVAATACAYHELYYSLNVQRDHAGSSKASSPASGAGAAPAAGPASAAGAASAASASAPSLAAKRPRRK